MILRKRQAGMIEREVVLKEIFILNPTRIVEWKRIKKEIELDFRNEVFAR